MKLKLNTFLVLLLIALTQIASAKEVVLNKHTLIPVRLAQNINGNLDNQGDTIYFEVLNDIDVEGEIVIQKGTFVRGKITNAETRKSMGKAGKLTIDARSLEAVDGQRVDIIRDTMTSEGRKRTGATVAHVIMWGPIGLLAKGRAARIMLDTEYDIEVESDVAIDTSKVKAQEQTGDFEEVNVNFKRYKSKINYAKGKKGKDFTLFINLPQTINLNANDVSITAISDHKLPKPIKPTSLNWNTKENAFEATLPFLSMVKFISPGVSSVQVTVKQGDKIMMGETTTETKWKLK